LGYEEIILKEIGGEVRPEFEKTKKKFISPLWPGNKEILSGYK
jgi:hypothetical protein